MSFSVLWTLLPNGYGDDGTLRLSLVASPRIADRRAALTDSPLVNWPAIVRNLPDLAIETKGSSGRIPAMKVGPTADSDLWQTIFSSTTKVVTRGAQATPPQITASPASFVRAHESLRQVRQAAAEERRIDTSGRLLAPGSSRALSIVRAITMAEDDRVMAASRGSRETVQQQMARLHAAGAHETALAVPFTAYARTLRTRRAGARARVGRPLSGVAPITAVDFHQVIGLLLTHPHLAIAVGLRIDLTIPAFEGPRSIRAVRADGQALNGDKLLPQPFSRVHADPLTRRFTMVAGPGPEPEVVQGMLAVAGDPDYVVTTTDVVGQSLQLVAQSVAMASASLRAGNGLIDDSLPARRDLGITIARRDRPAKVIAPSLERSAALHQTMTTAAALDQSLELFADDVTSGFRLDVARNGGRFRSLMTRRVQTTIGSRRLPAVQDEGRFEAFAGVEQDDEDGVPQLTAGEEFASWDGWAVAVPRPGFKVETQPGSPVTTAPVPPVAMPGYQIHNEITPVPGSLTPLRFGDTYELRARAVDLAGNSIDPAVCDPAQVLPPTTYLRTEGAPSPTLVLRRRYTEGESLHHLVVRSHDGVPEGTSCERHLAPPNASQALVERHGMFDAALGNSNQGVRDEMLALGRREAGSFLDPTVPGRDGVPVPARGIAVVTNDPQAPPPVTLPIPRGQGLPNGAYVIHDTDHPRLPYLADPIVEGVSLLGFPSSGGPVTALYGGAGWPDVAPMRLVVRPTTRSQPTAVAKVIDDNGRPALVLQVPPGFDETMELSSVIRRTLLPHLDRAGATDKEVVAGLVPEVSPRQAIRVVHAVRAPAEAPRIIGTPGDVVTADDAASYSATATVVTHAPTTALVDIEATWIERSDPGVGELVEDARVLRVGSAIVDRTGSGTVSVKIHQLFGDSRHRRITLTPWATTRFREYYKPVPDGDRSLQRPATSGTVISVPNRSRPIPPTVHSVMPLFTWARGVDTFGKRFGQRTTSGLRVWLERPWLTTGENELLGVVVHAAPPPADAQIFTRLQDLVSRWGDDPLELRLDAAPTNLTAAHFNGEQHVRKLAIPQAGETADGKKAQADVLGFPVELDKARGLWFADVLLTIDEPWPFVRLGVVRYQPESRLGKEISTVVMTDFAQLPPQRKVEFTKVGQFGVRARVIGPATESSTFTIRQERFMPKPFDPSTGLASDAGVGADAGWTVTNGPTGGQLRADMTLNRATSPGQPVLDELNAGRVVVEERQSGLALLSPSADPADAAAKADRVVFTESVLRKDI